MTLAEALKREPVAIAGYAVVGEVRGGEVGAAEVVDRIGRRAIAKWDWPVDAVGRERGQNAAAIVGRLRARGAKIPAYLAVEPIEQGQLILQEFVSGRPTDRVGSRLLDELVRFNRLQGDAVPDGSGWGDYVRRSLVHGLEGYCEHASLAEHDAATQDLLDQVQAAGAALESVAFQERDAVHLDFHQRNALVEDGRLRAVIDCEGYRSGDRIFDLTTLAFCLHVARRPPRAEAELWRYIHAQRNEIIVRAYVLHQALRQVDWSIRNRTPDQVESWLIRSRQLLDQLPP
ncbi:MAG TPA: phosphotransferase [Solirubrobacteraceae bacterium]